MRRAARLYERSEHICARREITFALDASIIGLESEAFSGSSVVTFPRSALKLQTLPGLRGSIPAWAALTEADFPEQKMIEQISPTPPPLQSAFSFVEN